MHSTTGLVISWRSGISRFSKKHLILVGLWHAKEKPFMLTFLRPVVDQLNQLYKEGMRCSCFSDLVMGTVLIVVELCRNSSHYICW